MGIKKELHPYNDAGRMLKAAMITSLMGNRSVDRTLQGMPEDVGDGWAELAEQLMRMMQGEVVNRLMPPMLSGGIH